MVKRLLFTILCLAMMITQSFQILAYDEEPYTPIIDEQIVSEDDITTVLQFDNYGRLKSRYSYTNEKELGAQSIQMTSGEASEDDSNIKSFNRINIAA